jgi:hypothetical protein
MARLRRTSTVLETARQRLAGLKLIIFPLLILLFMIGGTCSVALGQSKAVPPRIRPPLKPPLPPNTGTTLDPTRIRAQPPIHTDTRIRAAPVTAAPAARSADRATETRADSVSSGGGAPSPEVTESGDSGDSESPTPTPEVPSPAPSPRISPPESPERPGTGYSQSSVSPAATLSPSPSASTSTESPSLPWTWIGVGGIALVTFAIIASNRRSRRR